MSFYLPELVVESIIRDGIANMKATPEVIDDVFAQLTRPYASRKFGATEIQKIKDLLLGVNNQEIAIVHTVSPGQALLPAITIQLGGDSENKRFAHLDDFDNDVQEDITEVDELAALVRVPNLIPTSYNPLSGMVQVSDGTDLSQVSSGFIYEDGSGTEFELKSGISNDVGNKFFFIEKNSSPNIIDPGSIRTFLDYNQHEVRSVLHDVQLLLGVHTKEPLLTKYVYLLLKYFLLSRKSDMVKRGLMISSLSGTDFSRNTTYEADMVFTRFLTISGTVIDSWRSDDVQLIDSVEIDATPIDIVDED